MERPDGQLIHDYLKGDERALQILYERYIPSVYAFLVRLSPKQIDIDDLVQDAFVKAWHHLKSFDQHKSFKPWIFTIAKRTLLDAVKKRRDILFTDLDVEDGTPFDEQILDTRPLPSDLVESAEQARELEGLLDTLPWPSRLVITLHVFEDLTFQEIADMSQESIDTVKTRYRRALIRLRQHYEPK